jgi:hypothetical protein
MPFSEELKLRVKKQAAFQCCRCREIGVEVHHIVPEEAGGPDTEDNAAPLCPNCHTWFGDNPKKRKEIGQMRDWWYEVCRDKYGDREDVTAKKLDELLGWMRSESANEAQRRDVLSAIEHLLKLQVQASRLRESDSPAEVAAKVDRVVTATRLAENVYANFRCQRCGTVIGLLVGSDSCPSCGAPI